MTSVLRFVPVPAERPRAILDVHRRIAGLPVTHRRPPVARLMGSALRSASRNRLTEPADLRVLPRSFTKRLVGDAAMPNTNRPLPIQCPKCQHNGSTLLVKSLTILTLTCASCAHTWATQIEWLPAEIQERVHAILKDGDDLHRT